LKPNPNNIERRESVDFLEARFPLGGLDILLVEIDFGSVVCSSLCELPLPPWIEFDLAKIPPILFDRLWAFKGERSRFISLIGREIL
jgi:hypothetical protein